MLFIVSILDPIKKIGNVSIFWRICANETADLLFQTVWNSLIELFNEYAKVNGMANPPNESNDSVSGAIIVENSNSTSYKKLKRDKGVKERNFELKY